VWEDNYEALLKTSIKVVKDYSSAEDILADLMCRIFEREKQLTIDEQKYYPYLRRAVYLRSLNYLRDRKRKREVSYDCLTFLMGEPDEDEQER
jgi:DNA-directed RNA polymerase specialized sigma24 family protein